jgi:hypothetical protein
MPSTGLLISIASAPSCERERRSAIRHCHCSKGENIYPLSKGEGVAAAIELHALDFRAVDDRDPALAPMAPWAF